MSGGLPSPNRPGTAPSGAAPRVPLRRALADTARDWYHTEGPLWVHVGKAVFAGLLALYLAMRLELPSPRTALTTVFVVMTPQSGMVLSKSFYRLLGTLAGLTAMLTLISLFSQAHALFLAGLAAWIGVCTAGSARNRHFRSYGFLLAGYTAALVGVTNAEAPLGAFDASVTRAIEVSLGILCSAVVSSVIFPRYASAALQTHVRARFGGFVEFVRAALRGSIDRTAMERRNMGFIAEVVGLEALRSYTIFEDPVSRRMGAHIARFNGESMSVATRFHALHQLLERVRAQGAPWIVEAITPYLHELSEQLSIDGESVPNAAGAARVAAQLDGFKARLPARLRATRAAARVLPSAAAIAAVPHSQMRDFDSATELLYRFVVELHYFASTYAALRRSTPGNHAPERTRKGAADPGPDRADRDRANAWRYTPKTNGLMAAIAGARAGVTLLLVSAFWIFSGWPSGDFAAVTAGTVCALVSASPQPARAAVQMSIGSALACLAGYVFTFHVLVDRSGFLLMAAGLAPFLMFGAWLTTRRNGMGAGMGFCIFFCFLAGPDNRNNYDVLVYVNNCIALMVAMGVSAAAFGILLPPTTGWLLRRMAADLRRQVGVAGFGKLAGLAHRFDNQTRDYMFQIGGLTAEKPAEQRAMLGWMFAVLEIGHALIELREEFASLPAALARDPLYQPGSRWRQPLRALRRGLVELFERPSAARWRTAADLTTRALAQTEAMLPIARERDERQRLQRILSYLHFIHTALLDPQSPLAACGGAATASMARRDPPASSPAPSR
ncbi:FUSC family protein [Robbsia sp. Bb-Pol-6]|uniref:FUSC family protein n=1 Tax=Robbsia betulipollinis TaxID=2981849 RepID=A0ABT3ZNB6_9BURK|nr:FUSC family protein [Robbsia betulipollinis]MCY0388043.1 FUSC family protein [Robbsia betulipollinis]